MIRPFTSSDFEACVLVIQSNTPRYFAESEEAIYRSFLEQIPGEYFVVEDQNQVLGCGGWALNKDSTCALTWGMVQANQHGKGIGSRLLKHRLDCIFRTHPTSKARIETIPAVAPFFEKFGFSVTKKVENGFGNGFDQWIMVLNEW